MAANMVQSARSNCDFYAETGMLVESALPVMAGHTIFEQVLTALIQAAADEEAAGVPPATGDPTDAMPAATAELDAL